MPRESKKARKERTGKIVAALKKAHPDAKCALEHRNALELLVATILSAQCTDERVNALTPELFRKYRTAADWAAVPQEQLEPEIRSTGFYRNKAKSIRAAASAIAEQHGGRVPDAMDDLVALPGVARKTANVVLGTAYDKNEGIVVDTHVSRVSKRLKLTNQKTAVKIERDLMELVPRKQWTDFSHLLIFHGRRICTARKPRCADCPVNDLCPSAFKV